MDNNHRVPEGEALYLGVNGDADCLLDVCGLVDEDGAQAVSVAHDWDPRVILDVAHEAVTAPRDDEVDVLVELQQCGHLCPGLDGLDVC